MIEKLEGSDVPGWTLTKLDTNQLLFGGHTNLYSPVLTIPIGTWHHVVARRSGDELKLFFDASDVGTAISPASILDTAKPLLVGRRNSDDGRDFSVNGSIHEIAIWQRALGDEDIDFLYNGGAGNPVPEPSTLALAVFALLGLGCYGWRRRRHG